MRTELFRFKNKLFGKHPLVKGAVLTLIVIVVAISCIQLIPNGTEDSSAATQTYADLMAAVQGETNANAHYLAFAAEARTEGYYEIANLFTATAAAESIHALSEWNMLVSMGAPAADRPVADTTTVGSTAENLQAAFDGETYEWTVMYPGFAADATVDGNAAAVSLFTQTGKVENIHANNFRDALDNLNDDAYLNATFSTVYLCPVCGAVFDTATLPSSGRCTICGTSQSLYVQYSIQTYIDLMNAVQGETNAVAHYLAFADKAIEEGYPDVANLFTATAAAESIHAQREWNVLVTMGAKASEKPVADTPTVGTTAENLQAAFDGETYEWTVMYPGFAGDATAGGYPDVASMFTQIGRVENFHANNFIDALNNLDDAAYLGATFSTVYLCPVCGAVFDAATLPASGRCPVCGTAQSLYVIYETGLSGTQTSDTYADLMAALQGETNANVKYLAFAEKAREEGHYEIANLFTATAAAESIHALREWNMLVTMGATTADRPVADTPTVGSTAENLQAAFDGETYEYTTMYPGFADDATADGNTTVASMFTQIGKVENIHADNFTDALDNLNDDAYLNATFSTVYLCPVCGAVFDTATLPSSGRCTICGTSQSLYVQYSIQTYIDLLNAVQGETNAVAHYLAFAEKAKEEGHPYVANLFTATAAAESIHALREWNMLVTMGATEAEKPVADTPTVGTTAENLQAAFDGETYEYTTMYPGFADDATAGGYPDVAGMFTQIGRVENIHADNFIDAQNNLDDAAYLGATFSTVYLCPVCGAVFDAATLPAPGRCSVCGTSESLFVIYDAKMTYTNLMAAVQGELNDNAMYLAFADEAYAEGYPQVAILFKAIADADLKHADDEWAVLVGMGATAADKPVAETFVVGTTAENLQNAYNGETYEWTVMYPDYLATAQTEGQTDAATIFNYAVMADHTHAGNFFDALNNLDDAAYLSSTYGTLYRCPDCGAVYNTTTMPASRCPVSGTEVSAFVLYNQTYINLFASVQGELNDNAKYLAFADKANEEGYPQVALLFWATADADLIHADDEWAVLVTMGATAADKPVAEAPTVGTTAENLQNAYNAETYEWVIMYPGFLATAQAEGQTDAALIFNYAMQAEKTHAGNFADVLDNLDDSAYLSSVYGTLYLCPTCGEVVTAFQAHCPICGTDGNDFLAYGKTYDDLLEAFQAAENNTLGYNAYCVQALRENNIYAANLFLALEDAENQRAIDIWAILQSMGATDMPMASQPVVGNTAENLQAAKDEAVFENTVMYPNFLMDAKNDREAAAEEIFDYSGKAAGGYVINFEDAMDILDDPTLYCQAEPLYRCPVCGEISTGSAPVNCPICGTNGSAFIEYNPVCSSFYRVYNTLDEALADVPTGSVSTSTIKLLTNITEMGRCVISSKNIIFNLNGYDLIFQNSGGYALVLYDSNISYEPQTAGSNFDVIGTGGGLYMEGGSCALTYAETNGGGCAVECYSGATVTVNGDIKAEGDDCTGVYADDSDVTVNGIVTLIGNGFSVGIDAEDGSVIYVDGDVTADGDFTTGVTIADSSNVTVTGNVTITSVDIGNGCNASGVYMRGIENVVTVDCGIVANGDTAFGIIAINSTDSTVNADVTVTGNNRPAGVYLSGSDLTLNGDVILEGEGAGLVLESGCSVYVSGSVTVNGQGSESYGIFSDESDNTVSVDGGISVSGDNSVGVYAVNVEVTVNADIIVSGINSCGVKASDGSLVTLSALIASDNVYIIINDVSYDISDISMQDAGYWVYTDSDTTVMVFDQYFKAVSDITGVYTTATAGMKLTLSGTVAPSDASNQTIVWSILDTGTTGATLSSNVLSLKTTGTVIVTATIEKGTTPWESFTKDFSIVVKSDFIAVSDIIGVPSSAAAGTPLTLSGKVMPINASNSTIVWSVKDAGTTGATLSGNVLSTAGSGTVIVTASVASGKMGGIPFTKDFPITVSGSGGFVPVTEITGVTPSATAGVPLALGGIVMPTGTTNTTIVWSIKDAGTTGATISGDVLSTTNSGTVIVTATIINGKAAGSSFTEDFTITVGEDVGAQTNGTSGMSVWVWVGIAAIILIVIVIALVIWYRR